MCIIMNETDFSEAEIAVYNRDSKLRATQIADDQIGIPEQKLINIGRIKRSGKSGATKLL